MTIVEHYRNNLWTWRNALLWLLWACLASLMFYSAFLMFWPIEVIRVDKIVVENVLHPGQRTAFHFLGQKYKDFPAHVTVELVNGENHAIMTYTANNNKGEVFKQRPFIVPLSVIPGRYRLKWTGVYEVSALRSITYIKYSDYIEVIDGSCIKGPKGDRGPRGLKGDKGDKGNGYK